jgi:hypothetical protein
MIYLLSDTIPANTAEADARQTTIQLTTGVIHKVDVHFPRGCAGLAHLQFYEGGHQVFPTTLSTDFASDNETISFPTWYVIAAAGEQHWIRTWNLDDTYDHTVTIRIGLMKEWQLGVTPGIVRLVNTISKLSRRFR